MKKLIIETKKDLKHLVKTVPTKDQIGEMIDEDCEIYADGKLAAVYLILPESEIKGMRHAAENVKISSSRRSQGLPQKSAVFGPVPRKPNMAQDYCRFTRASHEQKEFLPAIVNYNNLVNQLYKQHFFETWKHETEQTEKEIHKDWKWLDGPFTNCNFNVNQAIPHHFDTANSKGAKSNVLILKKNIAGGELVCPELGFTLSQRDRAFVLFDGQGILHGVLPLREQRPSPETYRASIVLYTLSQLKKCLCKNDEIKRAKNAAHEKNKRTTEERNALIKKMIGKK